MSCRVVGNSEIEQGLKQSLSLSFSKSEEITTEMNSLKEEMRSWELSATQKLNEIRKKMHLAERFSDVFFSYQSGWGNYPQILLHIYEYIRPGEKEVVRWSLVCKAWKRFLLSNAFKKHQVKFINPGLFHRFNQMSSLEIDWKQIYKLDILKKQVHRLSNSIEVRRRQSATLIMHSKIYHHLYILREERDKEKEQFYLCLLECASVINLIGSVGLFIVLV